ncbi:MAG TPA: M1 family metallopeptidase [Flavisolibacter sp.]|jgi:aminopeptidase N|nr:M1 family metallopeptidase [Flavisolibacter sp.]
MKKCLLLFFPCFFLSFSLWAQTGKETFTRLDTIFGSNTPQRAWWDVQHYDLTVAPDYATKSITGKTTIRYKVITDQPHPYLQVDLQAPMQIDSIYYNGSYFDKSNRNDFYQEGNHYFLRLPKAEKGSSQSLTITYHGKPKEAVNAPWDGGWVWTKDKKGRPWMSVACEDDGASTWYPCKDLWSDEPDLGASLTVIVPEELTAVGNGRLKSQSSTNGKRSYTWEVTSPINSYNIIPYIGHYTNWSDTLSGEGGKLDLTYWVLDYEQEKAKKQFSQVKPTLRSFEHWFGSYPFYKDGYQLVQSPYLGMEHQSAVAYGNGFQNGYLGGDLSGTGWGLKWDYIIVHETGHEWFGNNLTAKDKADMWIHESFTDYSESLFIESYWGKEAANAYTQGLRKNILNDRPVVGTYGVRNEGSGDMYFKGANIIHTVRQIINNDEVFRQILRGLNKTFYHQTVTGKQVEEYIIKNSGKDLRKVFDQYLRTTKIPRLEYRQSGNAIQYRWANVIAGFNMPVQLDNGTWFSPTTEWKSFTPGNKQSFSVDKNFYINVKKL